MIAGENGPSKCSRKSALTLFFAAELFAFIFSLIALISPTWQYVNLENGRTEHHHGLWLDCKRDYSHEYGRNREFYETLNRLDVQQHPFDHFFLPPLDCVYKFDYYIDTEDLYDHNHDENRLQDDANQHLFLGWKIAALSAFGLAVLASGVALLLCVCAFCHRTLICAATVLVCVATVLSSVGISVFYIWANYQDNNIIKEDDGIYEQYFGWAFYAQIIGTCLHFIASFLGCVATSIAFTRSAPKLVKIERSFSAIYKVDSAALRQWEKDYMNKIKEESFIKQRTGSMPNIRKGERFQQRARMAGQSRSSSQTFLDTCSSNRTLTTNTFDSGPDRILSPLNTLEPGASKHILKSALKQPPRSNARSVTGSDITYEILPCDTSFDEKRKITRKRRVKEDECGNGVCAETLLNTYDKVYEPARWDINYEEPKSARSRNSLSSFGDNLMVPRTASKIKLPNADSVKSFDELHQEAKSTLINDIAENRPRTAEPQNSYSDEECTTSLEFLQLRNEKKLLENKRNSFSSLKPDVTSESTVSEKPVIPLRLSKLSDENNIRMFAYRREEMDDFEAVSSPLKSEFININTFDVGSFMKKTGPRSITNFPASLNDGNVAAFNRDDSFGANSVSSFPSSNKRSEISPERQIAAKQLTSPDVKSEEIRSLVSVCPEEIDRSIGSSAISEGHAVSESPYSYLKDTDLRLNLFMNGVAPLNKSDSSSYAGSSGKETNVTTV